MSPCPRPRDWQRWPKLSAPIQRKYGSCHTLWPLHRLERACHHLLNERLSCRLFCWADLVSADTEWICCQHGRGCSQPECTGDRQKHEACGLFGSSLRGWQFAPLPLFPLLSPSSPLVLGGFVAMYLGIGMKGGWKGGQGTLLWQDAMEIIRVEKKLGLLTEWTQFLRLRGKFSKFPIKRTRPWNLLLATNTNCAGWESWASKLPKLLADKNQIYSPYDMNIEWVSLMTPFLHGVLKFSIKPENFFFGLTPLSLSLSSKT